MQTILSPVCSVLLSLLMPAFFNNCSSVSEFHKTPQYMELMEHIVDFFKASRWVPLYFVKPFPTALPAANTRNTRLRISDNFPWQHVEELISRQYGQATRAALGGDLLGTIPFVISWSAFVLPHTSYSAAHSFLQWSSSRKSSILSYSDSPTSFFLCTFHCKKTKRPILSCNGCSSSISFSLPC